MPGLVGPQRPEGTWQAVSRRPRRRRTHPPPPRHPSVRVLIKYELNVQPQKNEQGRKALMSLHSGMTTPFRQLSQNYHWKYPFQKWLGTYRTIFLGVPPPLPGGSSPQRPKSLLSAKKGAAPFRKSNRNKIFTSNEGQLGKGLRGWGRNCRDGSVSQWVGSPSVQTNQRQP